MTGRLPRLQRLRHRASAPRTRSRAGHRRAFSPLTARILALNILALGILVGGLLYLGDYRQGLIEAERSAMLTQGRVFAAALGESTVYTAKGGGQKLDAELAQMVVRRMVAATRMRARLFVPEGSLAVDSRRLSAPGGMIEVEELPPVSSDDGVGGMVIDVYDWFVSLFPQETGLPPYREPIEQTAEDYSEVAMALAGETSTAVRRTEGGGLIISVAVPVQRLRQVAGAIMLTKDASEIEASVRSVRLDILTISGVVLAVTVLLSFYLAGTIARPVRRLAEAAERVRRGAGRRVPIPDFTARRDEIGDLSGALRDMTAELLDRLEAIERFAADVAHEIKNPLTSLKSAVETAARVEDPEQQKKLLAIIQEDVHRLDRLITDISHASRLDAEIARAETATFDVAELLRNLADGHNQTAKDGVATVDLHLPDGATLSVHGVADQVAQVVHNLVGNAVSFSPPGARIAIAAARDEGHVAITVEDKGPGIPEAKLTAIFDRFYTDRPEGRQWGTHSGLGLSISKQIVEAHGGTIAAENVTDSRGEIAGARFVIRLPAA